MRCAWCVTAVLAACAAPPSRYGDPPAEVAAVMAASAAAWNRGDLAAFMADYAADSTLRYLSGGRFARDWQALADRYQRAYFAPGRSHDSLAYDDLDIRALTPDLALVTARFRLLRGDSVTATGPFTLVLQRRGPRWTIIHDHTSSDPSP